MIKIIIAQKPEEICRCFPVMKQLRPQLEEDTFLAAVLEQQKEGYVLAYLESAGEVKAVTGYRFIKSLSTGLHMYVDDLVTDENSRAKGYGSKLFDHLVDIAKSRRCSKLRLDSRVTRFEAHRFYLHKGMDITSHHFDLNL